MALLGSNGAGKSTTLKAISGLLPMEDGEVTDGEIRFGGVSLAGLQPHEIARRGVFQVLEGRRVFEELTVEENLSCASYARGGAGGSCGGVREGVRVLPAARGAPPPSRGYSLGREQQMLAIGRALVARPRLMLLDEPSLGLSPILVEEIFGIVSRINREEGTTILLVEQNANMALSVSSFGYILENGKIVLDGPTSLLREDRDVREFYLGGHVGQRKSLQGPQALQAEETVAVLTADTLPKRLLLRASENPSGVALREKEFGVWQRVTWGGIPRARPPVLPWPPCTGAFTGRQNRHSFRELPRVALLGARRHVRLGGGVGVYPTSPAAEVNTWWPTPSRSSRWCRTRSRRTRSSR